MRIVYYSPIDFSDCDFPLLREYEALGNDVYYFVPLLCNRLSRSLISIKHQIPQSKIIPVSAYDAFDIFSDYLPRNKSFVVNRLKKGTHPRNLLLYLKLLLIIIKIRPDVIQVSYPFSGPEVLLYLLRSKIVLTVHDPFQHSGEITKQSRRQRLIAFRLLKKFILLNQNQKEEFVRHYHIKGDVHISRLGTYDNLRGVIPVGEAKKPYILFFGRISPYKGVERLCEAMRIVHEQLPSLNCVIAGGGNIYFDHCLFEAKDYIDFRNRYITPEELVGLIRGAAFVVLPYVDATQSGVVCSSFALETPVIASDVGALSEAITNGKTGLLLNPDEDGYVERLASEIVRLYSDAELLNQMRQNIREETTSGERSWRAIAEGNLEFYKRG